jgi:hypothetical protein
MRLDNATSVVFGKQNVLSVFVDPKAGLGWFYDGGGIHRKTWLHGAPPVHIATDGVHAYSQISPGPIYARSTPHAWAHRIRWRCGGDRQRGCGQHSGRGRHPAVLHFALFDAAGAPVGEPITASAAVPAATRPHAPAATISKEVMLPVTAPELWSVARRYLYTLWASSAYSTRFAWVGYMTTLVLLLRLVEADINGFYSTRFQNCTNDAPQKYT